MVNNFIKFKAQFRMQQKIFPFFRQKIGEMHNTEKQSKSKHTKLWEINMSKIMLNLNSSQEAFQHKKQAQNIFDDAITISQPKKHSQKQVQKQEESQEYVKEINIFNIKKRIYNRMLMGYEITEKDQKRESKNNPEDQSPKKNRNKFRSKLLDILNNKQQFTKQKDSFKKVQITKKNREYKYQISLNLQKKKEKEIEQKVSEQMNSIHSQIDNKIRGLEALGSKMEQSQKIQQKPDRVTDFRTRSGNNVNKSLCQVKRNNRIYTNVRKNELQLPSISSKANQKQSKYPLLMYNPLELKHIKSESFIIVQYPSQRIVLSKKSASSLEIASLTKLMTFYVVKQIAQVFKISDLKKQKIVVGQMEANITGTSAEVYPGEVYSVQDLLYGLMLPSGNDAALCLAVWGGKYLSGELQEQNLLIKTFVSEMNKTAKTLGLLSTRFGNPHGLPHQDARSTAFQISKICCILLKNELFQKIVSTKTYRMTVSNEKGSKRSVYWENTNKLLRRPGFIGLKTGITVTAGPCLASAYKFRDKTYVVVVLRAAKISGRFKQTRKLLLWSLKKLFAQSQLTEQQKNIFKKLNKKHELDSQSQDETQFDYGKGGEEEIKKRCNILTYEM